ncbi:hypothetical protein ACH5RR_031588 [Cinchona calisaya]|uniref:NB-ARC domain-containing protein n=1 Tax=Cinchona calisaya TaxID=153742 RepID=A0ABD2YH11_9GENT
MESMGFLFGNLQQLVKENGDLISGAGCEVTKLSNNLGLLKRFLTDEFSSEKKDVAKEIKVEHARNVGAVGKKIEAINKAMEMYVKNSLQISSDEDDADLRLKEESLRAGANARKSQPGVTEADRVINLEDGVEEVIERLVGKNLDEVKISLVRESDSERKPDFEGLEVMSIVGMLGLGKTRLARKVLSHPVIDYMFFTRIFVTFYQEYNKREVLQTILLRGGFFKNIKGLNEKPEVFERTPTLKKLGICGKLRTIVEANGESNLFDSFFRLQFLENLKLTNDDARFKLLSFPPENKFPAKLTRLSLQNTKLDWIEMSKLGKLKCLMVLKPEVFERTPTLKKLGICGKLRTIVEANGESNLFDSFFRLEFLEILKLTNDDTRFKLRSLPPESKFPAKLTRLSLQNTKLDWIEMSKLGKLKCLMVLKLKDNTFKGKFWMTEDGGFHSLEVLSIEATDLMVWKAGVLKHCSNLEAIPAGLADVKSLEMIDLKYTSVSLVSSARRIQVLKLLELQRRKDTETSTFKLKVFPPELSSPSKQALKVLP